MEGTDRFHSSEGLALARRGLLAPPEVGPVVLQASPVMSSTVVVAVDVGKTEFAVSVTDATRTSLLKPRTGCPMTGPSLARVIADIVQVLPADAVVKVGIEAAGHYHRPLMMAGAWPADWEVLELNPGHVTEQRRVLGKRTIKTDVIDLQAMTELLLAGRGQPVRDRSLLLGELTAWSAHRTARVALRTATKNQLLGQLDRTFPGLTLALPDVLATKVGRLVAAEFADPARLAALGSTRFIRFGATRGLQIRKPVADRLIQAAREALPTADAAVARAVLAADLALLAVLCARRELLLHVGRHGFVVAELQRVAALTAGHGVQPHLVAAQFR